MTSLDALDRIEKLFFYFYISVNGVENEGTSRECGNGRRHIVRRRKIDKEAQEDTTYRTIMVTSIFSLDNKMVKGRDTLIYILNTLICVIYCSRVISVMPFRRTLMPHTTHSFSAPVLRPAFSTFFFRRYQSIPLARIALSASLYVHSNNGSTLREFMSSPWECKTNCVKKSSRNVFVNGCRLMKPKTLD